ncbi:coleoptericin-like [Anthonomus grandis grandis]|uniref:coleoptericin-like n=1 Tax=Anthonomus grandis grandis TaxID=2921223 RepID=UPI002165E76F|nr:coleoptericin-like [Anthonomus grandis grandis]
MSLYPTLFLLGCMVYATMGYPNHPPPLSGNPPIEGFQDVQEGPRASRLRRYADGDKPTTKRPGWEVQPDLSRDGKGNTKGRVVVENHGKDHDFEAGWGQTIRGPDKHSETWHVGGSYRW